MPDIESELLNFCEKVLTYFVDKFGKLYGKQFISHKMLGYYIVLQMIINNTGPLINVHVFRLKTIYNF